MGWEMGLRASLAANFAHADWLVRLLPPEVPGFIKYVGYCMVPDINNACAIIMYRHFSSIKFRGGWFEMTRTPVFGLS
jgi:hypothetical protein